MLVKLSSKLDIDDLDKKLGEKANKSILDSLRTKFEFWES